MKGELHASIVALDGYASFLHTLLAALEWYPTLRTIVEDRIARFVDGERGRNKYQCPALGEWLPLLALSDKYTWRDVAHEYLMETFDRNAKWVLKAHPELLEAVDAYSPGPRHARRAFPQLLRKAFDTSKVSMRLLMFHVTFLRLFRVRGPAGLGSKVNPGGQLSTTELKAQLDDCYGRPTPSVQDAMQAAIKAITKVTSWNEVFARVGLTPPSPGYLSAWLKRTFENSERRRYHRRYAVVNQAKNQVRAQQQRAATQKVGRSHARRGVEVDEYDESVRHVTRDERSARW